VKRASIALARRLALLLGLAAAACSKSEASTKPAPNAVAATVAPDPRGCLAVTIHHEEHTEAQDGVSHDVRYDDKFVRCQGAVWTERVLPRGAPKETEHGGHRHLPPAFTMARYVTKTDSGTTFALVSRADRQVIEIGRDSYDTVHFDGDFDAAAHLIASSSIAQMIRLEGRAAPPGSEWREKKSAGGAVRVLFSTTYDFPLEIETEAANGAKKDRMVVTIEKLPADGELPWRSIEGYAKKSDSDFMD
jgi:hypothetical protein